MQSTIRTARTSSLTRGQILLEPDVERVRRWLDLEAHLVQPIDDMVPLHPEMLLQRQPVLLDPLRFQQRHGGHLDDVRGAAVEEGTGLGDGGDELFGPDDPAAAPAGAAPVLGQTVDQDDRVLVDVCIPPWQ